MSWLSFEGVGSVVGGLVGGFGGGLVQGVTGAAVGGAGGAVAGAAAGAVVGAPTGPGEVLTIPSGAAAGAAGGAVIGGSIGAVEGVKAGIPVGQDYGASAGRWLDDKISQMTGADEEADKAPNTGDQTDACSTCQPPPPDPDDDSNDPNKVNHVFGEGQVQKHKLEGVLKSYGGEKVKAYRALQEATRKAVGSNPGRFQTTVSVNNYNVTVRGATVNGTPRISTAFIP